MLKAIKVLRDCFLLDMSLYVALDMATDAIGRTLTFAEEEELRAQWSAWGAVSDVKDGEKQS